MLFFPYRFDLDLNRMPWFTAIVMLICVGVYTQQFTNEMEFIEKTERFCATQGSTMQRMAFEKALGDASPRSCVALMQELAISEDAQADIAAYAAGSDKFAGLSVEDSRLYVKQLLEDRYASYQRSVPAYRTGELWYQPHSWNPLTMLTANFAHADWLHLVGNLVFFYAFAAAVEVIIGSLPFLLVVLATSFGTSIAYSLSVMHLDEALPTVGLSGVVMAMITMLAWLLPQARIRCFYMIIIFWFGRIAVPAWILALVYIGLDVVTLATEEEVGGINLIAHVSGALLGLLFAMLLFGDARRNVRLEWTSQHRAQRVT